jgi:MFS family permease
MFTAAVMLSHQTAGKAARDAFFLSQFPVQKLPAIVMAAALLSILLGFFAGRWMERRGPGFVIPRLYLFSGVLQFAELALVDVSPAFAAPLIYLHIVGLGAILLSGFWSLTSEHLNPREAKRIYGRIAGVGTLGGIAGGILAERIGAWFGMKVVLAQLGAAHPVKSFIQVTETGVGWVI